MATDITSTVDIEQLVQLFYKKVMADDLLSPYFKQTNLEEHIPVMVKFWENAIFYTGSYTGNPMDSHKKIHHMFTFSETDFERWLLIFNSSVDELFKGVNALLIKQKAHSISTVMKLKLIGKKEETNL